jgi:tetratricopeptide (TPR) repeat protein
MWKCAQEEGAENLMLERVKNGRRIWGNEIEGMTIGRPDELTRESAGDPLENARAFESDGLARQDAFLLKQAAQAYRSCNDMPKYRECRARALEAEGQLFEAGDAYFEAGFAVPEGVRGLWRAGKKGWVRLCEKAVDEPQIRREIEFEWARGITEKIGAVEVAKILSRYAKRFDDDPAFADACVGDLVWLDALGALLQPLIDKVNPSIAVRPLNQLVLCFDRLRAKGLRVPAKTCASIYFIAGRHGDALELWDESKEAKPADYFKAKASVEPYPQRILSLSKLDLTEEIVQAYLAASQVPLNPEEASAVVDAFRVSNRLVSALNLAWEAAIAAPMLRLAVSAALSGDNDTASPALHAGLIFLVNQEEWEPLTGFASSLRFAPTAEWKADNLTEFVRSESDNMQVTLVRALARSEKLPDAPTHVQRQLSNFLRRYLRVKEGAWKARLSIFEAGSAFERVGRFTDAIAFYEAVLKEQPGADEKQFARRRFLVCKQRQLIHERAQGATLKAAEILRELKRDQLTWEVGTLDELPRFPELAPLEKPVGGVQELGALPDRRILASDPTESTSEESGTPGSDHVVLTGGPFKIEGSRKNNRCNITHTETMETAFVKIGERKCGGEVDFNQLDEDRWICEPWKLTVQFSKNPGELLSIDSGEFGLVLTVRP